MEHSGRLARLRASASFARALVGTNLRASFALRGAFWFQMSFMVLNNVIWFSMWWIFFARFEEVRGWRIEDLAVLYGVVAGGFGLTVVLCGGVRELARSIHDGDLDAVLTQPKSPLLLTLASRTAASGWGDLVSGLLLCALSGFLHPGNLPLALLAILLSASVFAATGVLIHSLAFWAGRVDTLARQAWEFLITFSIYPETLFTGLMKMLLFTVIPAGFIGFLPARLLRDFSPWTLLLAAAGAIAYVALAIHVFRRGLRHYESGNRFGVRG